MTSADEHIDTIRARGEDRDSHGCARHAPAGGCIGSGCTQVQETTDYNNRLQPVRFQVGTQATPSANYCLVYNYYAGVGNPLSCINNSTQAASGNNGNVAGFWYQDNVNTSFSRTEAYGYDNLNRLGTAVATGNSTYNLTFGYDRYGNATCVLNANTNGPCPQYSYTTNNQISGYTYDAAGNLANDGTYTYQWDAEGRMTTASQGGTVQHTYTYNALNQMVKDVPGVQPSNTQEHFYSVSGKRLGDFFSAASTPGWWHILVPAFGRTFVDVEGWYVGAAWFYHYNALGSALIATRHDGTEVQDTHYYPWGEGWLNSGSWATDFYAGLSSLDCQYAPCFQKSQTRSYAGYHWLSPDRHRGDRHNPQSWDRYVYVLDNPVNFADPSGLVNWWQLVKGGGQVLLGVGIIGAGAAAEAPTVGASTMAILAGGSSAMTGLWNIGAGLSESGAATEIADMGGTLSNPGGAVAGAITGNLELAEGAAAAFDLAGSGGDLASGEAFSTPLQSTVTAANTVSAITSAVQWNPPQAPVYVASNPTVVTVTAVPTPAVASGPTVITVSGGTAPSVPFENVPSDSQLVDEGGDGPQDMMDFGGGGGGGGGGGDGGGASPAYDED